MGFNRRQTGIVVSAVAILSAIAGCTEDQVATQVPVEFNVTATVERPDSETQAQTPTGDAAAGQELFNNNSIRACSGCHSTGDNKIVGPGLKGVYERAGMRVPALSADAYIEQSLREPQAFLVDGFPPAMPSFDRFSVGEVKDLIAYLKTLK